MLLLAQTNGCAAWATTITRQMSIGLPYCPPQITQHLLPHNQHLLVVPKLSFSSTSLTVFPTLLCLSPLSQHLCSALVCCQTSQAAKQTPSRDMCRQVVKVLSGTRLFDEAEKAVCCSFYGTDRHPFTLGSEYSNNGTSLSPRTYTTFSGAVTELIESRYLNFCAGHCLSAVSCYLFYFHFVLDCSGGSCEILNVLSFADSWEAQNTRLTPKLGVSWEGRWVLLNLSNYLQAPLHALAFCLLSSPAQVAEEQY